MATSEAEARAMLAAAQASGAPLMVAHCWRFDAQVRWLKGLIEAGRLGRVVRTRGLGVHVDWGPGGWFTRRDLAGGGALVDMGIHALDTARFLLGDPAPRAVFARMGTHYQARSRHPTDVEDTALALVEWEGGATSLIEAGWWQPFADGPEAATEVWGTDGYGRVFPSQAIVRDAAGEPAPLDGGFPAWRHPHCAPEMYAAQWAHFLGALREGTPLGPDGALGLGNQLILDAIARSAASGCSVHFRGPAAGPACFFCPRAPFWPLPGTPKGVISKRFPSKWVQDFVLDDSGSYHMLYRFGDRPA